MLVSAIQPRSMTLMVSCGICCKTCMRRVISRDENSDNKMGFIPDPSQTSLPEYKGNEKCRTSIAQPTLFSVQSSFSTLFPIKRPFAEWVAPLHLSQHNSPPPSKSHAPTHELILLMSEQCTNLGPPYPFPICLHPFNKSKFSFKCYGCLSWVHQRYSGLASYTLHHDLWRCSICQTPPPLCQREIQA